MYIKLRIIKNSNIYIIQRQIYGCPEKSPREKKPPGILSPRNMPPEKCPLGKSLIDIEHLFTVENNKLVNVKDLFTVNQLSLNVETTKCSF